MRLFVFLVLLIFYAAPAWAVPDAAKVTEAEKQLKEAEAKKKALEADKKKIEKDLKATRGKLVTLAKKIQDFEKQQEALNLKIANLDQNKTALEDRLKSDEVAMAQLLRVLVRLRITPPESLIGKPGEILEKAQTSLVLADLTNAIDSKTAALRKDLQALQTLREELEIEKQNADEVARKLEAEHTEMAALLNKRERLYAKAEDDLAAQKKSVEAAAKQAATVKELIRKIALKTAVKPNIKAPEKTTPSKPPKLASSRMPISGVIRISYGEKNDLGAKSEGITIEGPPGGLVIAPLDGTIKFAGSFKNYKNLVIVDHGGEVYSLIAGMGKIDVSVGQSISRGEPVGVLSTSPGAKPDVYYELRKKGKPVNPSQYFSKIS